jgi:hypothetical protein
MQERETTECCPDLQAKLQEWRECTEKTLQEEPLKVAGYAFAAGIVCAVFPVGWCPGPGGADWASRCSGRRCSFSALVKLLKK